MDPVIGDEDLGGFLQVVPGLVQRIRPEHIVLALPIAEGGRDHGVDRGQRKFLVQRFERLPVSPVVDADILLEEFHRAVYQPLPVPIDPDVPVVDDDPEAVLAVLIRIRLAKEDVALPDGFRPEGGSGQGFSEEEVGGQVDGFLFGGGPAGMAGNEASRHRSLVDNPHLRRGGEERQEEGYQRQCSFHVRKIHKKMQTPEGLHSVSDGGRSTTSGPRRRR